MLLNIKYKNGGPFASIYQGKYNISNWTLLVKIKKYSGPSKYQPNDRSVGIGVHLPLNENFKQKTKEHY